MFSFRRLFFRLTKRLPFRRTRPLCVERVLYHPRIEGLETRLAPATLGIIGTELDLTAVAGETITVAPSNSGGVQITTNDGLTNSNGNALANPFTIPSGRTTFNVYLANTQAQPDTLTFGGWGTSPPFVAVNIGANPDGTPPPPGTTPSTDQQDTVTLAPLSTNTLNVSAGTIHFEGGGTITTVVANYTGWAYFGGPANTPGQDYLAATTAQFPLGVPGSWPTGFKSGAHIYISGGYDAGLYTIASVSGNKLNLAEGLANTELDLVNAHPVSVAVLALPPTVTAANATLTAVNPLQLQTTAVPYEGAVTIHAAPPQGQPFAGDPYLTGPEWGQYYYQAGQAISFADASGTVQTWNIAAVVGEHLYLAPSSTSPTSPPATGTVADDSVECVLFYPQITANSLTLNVSGQGNSILGAMNVVDLSATTNNGNMTIQDLDLGSTPLSLGSLNAGTAQIQLAATGTITPNGGSALLTASAVNLLATGFDSSIGTAALPIQTEIGDLTATTNDGSVFITNSNAAPLTVNSVLADQGGQPAVVNDDQVVYNSTPDQSAPTYVAGSSNVSIMSTGPVKLNSISATGSVAITGTYIVEGNAQSPSIIAPSMALTATGGGNYQGQVTFANSSGGDTLTLPSGGDWNSLGFSVGDPIVVSGASTTTNNGTFSIASVAGNVLTLQQSYVLQPETDLLVTVGNGMIGLTSSSSSGASGAIGLSQVGSFSAQTNNGNIDLALGGAIDSTATSVNAGGTGNVSVTSLANFLTIENITAKGTTPPGTSTVVGGNVAVAMKSGSLFEYFVDLGRGLRTPGIISGQNVSLMSPLSIGSLSAPILTNAAGGLNVTANATSAFDAAVYVDNESNLTSLGVSTYGGTVAINELGANAPLLSFSNNQLSATGSAVVSFTNTDNSDGSADNVIVSGTINASSITAGGQILTQANSSIIGQAVVLAAGNGIGTPATPINTAVTALAASTSTGNIEINQSAPATVGSGATVNITTDNGAITSVTLGSGGSGYPVNSTVGLTVSGGGGTGGVVEATTDSSGTVTGIALVAGGDGYTDTDGAATSAKFMLLSASTSNGNINVRCVGGDDLILDGISTGATGTATFLSHAAIYNTTKVAGNSASANSATLADLSVHTLSLLAGGIIGTASNPLKTSVTSLTAEGGGLFLSNNTSLTLTTAGESIAGNVAISTIGDLTLNSAKLGTTGSSVSLTATAGALTTTGGGGSINASTLTMNAEQIGDSAAYSPDGPASAATDVIQTDATTINATAVYGGIYLKNQSPATLMLTAGAVGPTPGGTPTNNIDVFSDGGIVLVPQTSALPGAGTTPIAIYSPGGTVTLHAGYIASTYDVVSGLGRSLTAGMAVSGNGIPAGDTIQKVLNSSQIVLSEPATASVTGSLTFTPVVLTATGNISGATISNFSGSADSLTSGMPVSGFGIPAGDTINVTNGEITLAEPATFNGADVSLTFYSTTSSTTTGTTTGTSNAYFDVYAGTLTIDSSMITTSGSLSGTGYGPLVTQTNTAEVLVFAPIAITNSGPLELTASMLANGGTFTGSSITIGELGPQALAINGNLVLESTGAIVFLDPSNAISAGVDGSTNAPDTILVEAGSVVALGDIATDNGDVTIVAGGNVGVGVVNAGHGTVAIASSGSIFNINGGTLSITAGHTNLSQAQIQVFAQGQAPSTGTAQSSNLAELQLQASQALATAAAANAQAAAEQTTADAFLAELTSIQTAVGTDRQTYQSDVTATNNATSIANTAQNTVNYDTLVIDGLDLTEGLTWTIAGALGLAGSILTVTGDVELAIPLGFATASVTLLSANSMNIAANTFNLVAAAASLASASEAYTLYHDSQTLSTDASTAAADQSAQDVAQAQLQADMDTETAVAAAYNVAQQAALSDAITAKQDQAVAQADSALVQAASTQAQEASALTAATIASATATAQPLTVNGGPLTITGEAPTGNNVTNLTVSAPITIGYSISNLNANGTAWTVTTTAASGLAAGDPVTISGVTPAAYNGTWTVASAATTTAPYSFTITSTTNPGPAGFGGTAAAVPAGVTLNGNGSPTTVSANITAPGSIDLIEPAAAAGGDNLSVSPGATVASEDSSVALAAGDNIDISSGATIQASSTIAISADTNDGTYLGQVAFSGDTLTLPATNGGTTWSSLGFAAGGKITVSGAGTATNNGDFTIASGASAISADGYTLTLTTSSLTTETDANVTVEATNGASDAGVNVPGANVTVDGTLSAQSALINVPPESTRPATFNITPSLTTPITVAGGQSTKTLNVNFDTAGLAVTISETQATTGTQTMSSGTITATGMQTVTFTNIAAVNITDAAGGARVTLIGNSQVANTMSLVGTGQGAGTVTLDDAPLSFSGVASFSYEGGQSDTISVTPFATPEVSWALAVTVAGGSSAAPASLTFNSVASLADAVTATGAYAGVIGSPGLAAVQFSNVNTITANASQGTRDELTVDLPDGAATDTANLLSVGQTADIQLGLFALNVDTAYAGLTINGNHEGANALDLATNTGVGLPMPLTLNYTDFQSVVNSGTTSAVNATASGDTINVTNVSATTAQVEVTDVVGNVSTFIVAGGAANKLLFNGLGANDTIDIAGNNPFKNGIFVDGNAWFTDVINYTAGSGDAVSVTPSCATIRESGAGGNYGPVVYPGINRVNLIASGTASTLTVAGAAQPEDFDFTPSAAGAGSFTAGLGAAIGSTQQFSYTGIGSGITVNGGTSGSDDLGLTGTMANGAINTLTAEQTAAGTLAFTLNAFTVPLSLSNIASVNLSETAGNALFEVGVAAALERTPTASLNFQVVGSSIYNDHLLVKTEGSEPAGSHDVITSSAIAGSGSVTVGALNPVTYQNVQSVKFLPTVTVTDAGGTVNGKSFAATAQFNGGASLNGVKPTQTYYSYSGTFTPTVNHSTGTFTPPAGAVKLSGAPAKAGTYAVVASFAGTGTYASNWAWTTFTISQAKPQVATPQVSVHPLLSITGFSPGTPVAGRVLRNQNLRVVLVDGNALPSPQSSGGTATVSIRNTATGASDVLGTVAVKNGVLALKNMTIPASFAKSTCQLVVTLDGLVWTSSDFDVVGGSLSKQQ
jgi:hypothetical protein